MVKRVASGVLWFLAGWYVGAFLAFVTGVPPLVGPILGLAAALVVAGDPLGVFWDVTARTREHARRRLRDVVSAQ